MIAAAMGAIALSGCEEKYDPIVALEPKEKQEVTYTDFISRAETTFEVVHNLYWSDKAQLMFSKYPNAKGLGNEPTSGEYEHHAMSWGYGGYVSAFATIAQTTTNLSFLTTHEAEIKATLEKYYNTSKQPNCFACFVNSHDDRLYDDAEWIGIDMADMYAFTRDSWYLEKAKSVYEFILSGMDDKLGGGIYWGESGSNRDTKNTCSNAPAAVMCMKLYNATNDDKYLNTAKELYTWTKDNLQDPGDYLYFDNKRVDDGSLGTAKFSYNSGQMLQAAVLLYNATNNEAYITDARNLADACYKKFFRKIVSQVSGEQFNIIDDGHRWFNAIMLRGFAELNKIEPNDTYTNAIYKTLEEAWKYTREDNGLFLNNFSGTNYGDNPSDILQQGAIIEMFARFSTFKNANS